MSKRPRTDRRPAGGRRDGGARGSPAPRRTPARKAPARSRPAGKVNARQHQPRRDDVTARPSGRRTLGFLDMMLIALGIVLALGIAVFFLILLQ